MTTHFCAHMYLRYKSGQVVSNNMRAKRDFGEFILFWPSYYLYTILINTRIVSVCYNSYLISEWQIYTLHIQAGFMVANVRFMQSLFAKWYVFNVIICYGKCVLNGAKSFTCKHIHELSSFEWLNRILITIKTNKQNLLCN